MRILCGNTNKLRDIGSNSWKSYLFFLTDCSPVQKYNDCFFRPSMISVNNTEIQPYLNQTWGRIVLYFDAFTVPSDQATSIGYPWANQNVEDVYAMNSPKDYTAVKWPAILAGMESAMTGNGTGANYFNFISASSTSKASSFLFVNPEKAAAVLNPMLLAWAGWSQPSPIHVGCIMMDFPENAPDLIGTILKANYPESMRRSLITRAMTAIRRMVAALTSGLFGGGSPPC